MRLYVTLDRVTIKYAFVKIETESESSLDYISTSQQLIRGNQFFYSIIHRYWT
jgi:hypothetical protein